MPLHAIAETLFSSLTRPAAFGWDDGSVEMTTFASTDGFPHPALVGVTGPEGTRAVQGDPHAVLPLASVTKPLTAWGVFVAIERGFVDLDEQAGPAGSTVLNLLDHTSGLPMEGEQPQRPLGERRIYSNAGFDALAAHVADAVGMDFADWMLREVIAPARHGADRRHRTPVGGGVRHDRGSAGFGREVLRPTLIPDRAARPRAHRLAPGAARDRSRATARTPTTSGVSASSSRASKSPHWLSDTLPPETAGHFGALGSFLFIDRSRDVAAAFLSGVPFGEEHKRIWPPLTEEIVARYGR